MVREYGRQGLYESQMLVGQHLGVRIAVYLSESSLRFIG